jgi:hypothetical protein
MNYIECINVDFKSTRKESFYGKWWWCFHTSSEVLTGLLFYLVVYSNADLQLDVKGCQDVYASFDKYVEVERLEGDNKYHADKHGLQVSIMDPVIVKPSSSQAAWLYNHKTIEKYQAESKQARIWLTIST